MDWETAANFLPSKNYTQKTNSTWSVDEIYLYVDHGIIYVYPVQDWDALIEQSPS